jgi:hypothetical protein
MSQSILKGEAFPANHGLPALLAGMVPAVNMLAGASSLSLERPVVLPPAPQAGSTSPNGAADWQAAQRLVSSTIRRFLMGRMCLTVAIAAFEAKP